MDARNKADLIAIEEVRTDFRKLSDQHFDQAIEAMMGDNVDLAAIVRKFREAAADIASNIPVSAWKNEDYVRTMQASAYIIQNILNHPNQDEFSAKEETDYAMQMYNTVDHSKVGLHYYLAAYAASVNYAGQHADKLSKQNKDKITFAEYAAYAAHAEQISKIVWNKSLDTMPLTSEQMCQIAYCDAWLARIYLGSAQFSKALMSASQAIHGLGVLSSNFFDLNAVAGIYQHLAAGFAFDPTYAKLFQFASDLFSGNKPEASFSKLEEVLHVYTSQPNPYYQRNDMLLQILRLWKGKHELLSSDCVFNKEMSEQYCQDRFNEILWQREAIDSKPLDEVFTPIRETQDDYNDVMSRANDAMKRAEDVLSQKFPTFEELAEQGYIPPLDEWAVKDEIPSLEELAIPASGLLAKHGVFRVEQDSDRTSGNVREIKVQFGSRI